MPSNLADFKKGIGSVQMMGFLSIQQENGNVNGLAQGYIVSSD
jgi:hypothetical protein